MPNYLRNRISQLTIFASKVINKHALNDPKKEIAESRYSKIILAKISPLRYIAFTLLIRYVDIRVALTK